MQFKIKRNVNCQLICKKNCGKTWLSDSILYYLPADKEKLISSPFFCKGCILAVRPDPERRDSWNLIKLLNGFLQKKIVHCCILSSFNWVERETEMLSHKQQLFMGLVRKAPPFCYCISCSHFLRKSIPMSCCIQYNSGCSGKQNAVIYWPSNSSHGFRMRCH